MKNDHDRDETDSDSNEYEINGADADDNIPASAESDADAVTGGAAGIDSDWTDFQFDSPELAAYATYADDAEAAGVEADDVADAAVPDTDDSADVDPYDDGYDDDDAAAYEYTDEDSVGNLSFDPALDIDAALAAVGALPDLMAERDAADSAAYESEYQRQQEATRSAEQHERWREGYRFAQPPQMRLQRGQPASVIPALILIAVGAYLTFALTLSQTPPAPGIVAVLVCGAVGITLLAYWLNSRRWARGALFGGLLLILTGVVFYVISTPAVADTLPAEILSGGGWRLFVSAVFAALTLTGLLARPVSAGLIALGLAGLVGTMIQLLLENGVLGSLNTTLAAVINQGGVIIVPLIAILLALGLFQRIRQRRQIPAA